jgi:lysophospholipase L1-like esterase
LEQFIIDADIIWDQVGKTFFENPEAKAGRIMRVQVVNAGTVEDLTGYTLNLGWTCVRDPSKFGLDAFDDVDTTKGIFEIEYTSGMLTNIGPLNASLQLVPPGEGRPIESNNFKLTVKNSAINAAAIQGETSFSTLENALVEVNGWNARIDVVEQDFKDRADALDGAYPVRLSAAEQSVAAVEAQVDLLNRGLGETMSSLALLNSTYPTGDTKDHIVAGNIAEVDTLTVTGIPTTAGDVTVTLNGVAKTVPVTVGRAEVASLLLTAVPTVAGDVTIYLNGVAQTVAIDPAVETTTDLVAAKIRAALFAGWLNTGTGSTVIFTSTTVGTKTNATYSAGTTGAAGTMTTTVEGIAAATTIIVATAIRAATYTGWTTGGTGSVVTFTSTTPGTRTAPTFSGGTTGAAASIARTVLGEAANYHRYFWSGSAWTDGGIYQATEAEDGSVTPSKLKSTEVPLMKNPANYITMAATPSVYIPFTPLQKGIVNLVGKFGEGVMEFYLLKKIGGNFVVQKRVTKTVPAGVSSVITDFWAEGSGDEYIGFIGKVYFRHTGGVGFYEAQGANPESNLFSAPLTTAGALYDFSVYPTYSSIELVNQVKDKASFDYVEQALTFSIVSDTVVKDLNTYVNAAQGGNQYLYIPNVILGSGNLVAHWKGVVETGTFYILEKSGSNFTVKKAKTVSVTAGENIIDMEYLCSGSGNEYFGYFARSFYKNIGGSGMYESTVAVVEGQTFTPADSTVGGGAAFDFGVYYEYTGTPVQVIDEVKSLRQELDALVIPDPTTDIASVELTDFYLPHYSEIVDPIAYLGRWFDKTIDGVPCKVTINEGSEFYFKVKNTLAIAVNFKVITSSVMPYFAYSIDGAPLVRQLITNPNLPAVTAGEHIIRIVCDGLTEGENKWAGEIGFAVTGVTVDGGGVVTGILPKNRKIMFFGDSITEGIRVLNMNANSDGNSGSGAFPFTTCSNLNAISYRVGFGASGVTHGGSGGVPDCLQYIDKMTSLRDAPYFEPDAIVVNHGTNDSGSTSQVFQAAYNAVLNRLRVKYAGVPIFTMIPFNQAKAADIRACVSGRNDCYLVETSGWGVTYIDGTHPDVAGGITAGLKLSAAIKSVLGEGYFIK